MTNRKEKMKSGAATDNNSSVKMMKKGGSASKYTQPKVIINGKLHRKKHKYILRSLALLESLDIEIHKYCRGGENAILNYLIKEGLKNIKRFDSIVDIETEDLEEEL